jgi:site-specific recombinase XerD
MRCFIRQVKGNWHASFDYGGVSYTHSLRTKDEQDAHRRIGVIRDTLYRLENGTLAMPPGADPKAFLVSGGQHATKPTHAPSLTVGAMTEVYLGAVERIEANTKATKTIHLNHIKRVLGAETALDAIRQPEVQGYAKARRKERHHGRQILAYTIRKELRTFHQVWTWVASQGHAANPPSWTVDAVDLPKDRGREPFRGFGQIETMIARGHLSEDEQDRLWECLYLNNQEMGELLAFVKEHAREPFIYPMVVFVALTGCRRSEMARSLIDDWDLKHNIVHIREKKRDTSSEFTIREVDIHATLAEVMTDWFAHHPGGQYAITQNGERLTVDQATWHLNNTLRDVAKPHERWSKIRGFHTLRHSVASILASEGIDQRYIDRMIGHHTEAMRKRYQHLFPKGLTVAVSVLLR